MEGKLNEFSELSGPNKHSEPRAARPSMAEYGVPAELEGVLPWSWASERLVACRNFWVVTASVGARPHAMPVWGIWLEAQQEFWFGCARTARKHRNLLANPQVTFTTTDTVEVVSVEGRGLFRDDAIDDARHYAHIAISEKYADAESTVESRAAMVDFFRSSATWCVTPERAFGIIEREEEFAARATKWVW